LNPGALYCALNPGALYCALNPGALYCALNPGAFVTSIWKIVFQYNSIETGNQVMLPMLEKNI